MRLASESKPHDAMPMNGRPSTSPRSSSRIRPEAVSSAAASASCEIPSARARSLPRPPGSTASGLSDPASTPPIVEYAGIFREMPKIVFSKTLERADWNATILRDVDPEEILKLKAEPGGDMPHIRLRPLS